MAESSRPNAPDALRDLLAAGLGAYPAAINAAVTYWSEMVANASGYYTELLHGLITVLQKPQQGPLVFNDLAARLKHHLERSGDITERTILEFNQRLEAVLRNSATAAAPPDSASSPSTPPGV